MNPPGELVAEKHACGVQGNLLSHRQLPVLALLLLLGELRERVNARLVQLPVPEPSRRNKKEKKKPDAKTKKHNKKDYKKKERTEKKRQKRDKLETQLERQTCW